MPRKEIIKLELSKLLKRRKLTLKRFLEDFAITTYDQLVRTCEGMGVVPHSLDDFNAAFPKTVTNPAEGVAVFEAASSVEDTIEVLDEAPKQRRKNKKRESIEEEEV